jgi:hypothetical protein
LALIIYPAFAHSAKNFGQLSLDTRCEQRTKFAKLYYGVDRARYKQVQMIDIFSRNPAAKFQLTSLQILIE